LLSTINRVLVIPSAVFVSVLFGPGYGSGREMVEFVSKHGPWGGILAIIVIAVTFGILLSLSFEIARKFRSYNYQDLIAVLLGRGWFVYQVAILIGIVITLSICASAAGTVMEDRFGFPALAGSLLLLFLVIALNYQGRAVVEKSMAISVTALLLLLIFLLEQTFTGHWDAITRSFSSGQLEGSDWFRSGLTYGVVNGGFIPLLIYCARDIRTRAEAFTGGFFAGFIGVLPAAAFHLMFMAVYPEVIDQRLPTYWMIEKVTPPLVLDTFVIVLFVLIVQTGVGMLQGLIEQMDHYLELRNRSMSPKAHAAIAAAVTLVSMALGSMGIVALVARGYTFLSVVLLLTFTLPLLTRGIYKIWFEPGPRSPDLPKSSSPSR
jgi:uncharacterized membrane protein YkvI